MVNFKFLYSTVSTLKPEQTEEDTSERGRLRECSFCSPPFSFTDGWDGLHELVLLELEEDGGLPCAVQPQCYHPDLHLWTDVDPVVLNHNNIDEIRKLDLVAAIHPGSGRGCARTLVKVTGMPASS